MSAEPHAPMSRFAVPVLAELPVDIRGRIEAVAEKSGFVPNVFLLLARRPDEFRAFFAYHDALMERPGGLTKAEREMIVVVTSALNQCLYCVVAHGAILRIRAKDPRLADQVAVNYRKAALTPRQRAMLDFAVKVATARRRRSRRPITRRSRRHASARRSPGTSPPSRPSSPCRTASPMPRASGRTTSSTGSGGGRRGLPRSPASRKQERPPHVRAMISSSRCTVAIASGRARHGGRRCRGGWRRLTRRPKPSRAAAPQGSAPSLRSISAGRPKKPADLAPVGPDTALVGRLGEHDRQSRGRGGRAGVRRRSRRSRPCARRRRLPDRRTPAPRAASRCRGSAGRWSRGRATAGRCGAGRRRAGRRPSGSAAPGRSVSTVSAIRSKMLDMGRLECSAVTAAGHLFDPALPIARCRTVVSADENAFAFGECVPDDKRAVTPGWNPLDFGGGRSSPSREHERRFIQPSEPLTRRA